MLTIITYPDTILREEMPEFDFENPIQDPKELEKSMIEVMLANRGIGLSANQVGIRTRMFVMGHSDNAMGIFNPVVVEAENIVQDEEGCLSFPGIYTKVKRPTKIKAMWQDSNGERQQAEITGMTCKCFLHELDHLDGIVFQDRVSTLKWALATKKANKQKRKY
jgi:peptide deformylase